MRQELTYFLILGENTKVKVPSLRDINLVKGTLSFKSRFVQLWAQAINHCSSLSLPESFLNLV